MTTMQQFVVGVFQDHTQAERVISDLLQTGFDNHQIRFAGRGISAGGILDKIKSVFTGQDISAGGIYDDLVKMGVPPEDARYYHSEFEAGRAIVAVQANGRLQEATNILVRHGGYGASQRFTQSAERGAAAGIRPPTTESRTAAGVQPPTTESRAAAGVQPPTTENEERMKLHEEELRVRKQVVETGEARLHKDVVAEQKSMDVPVTREEVYIERRPGSGLPSDQPIGQEETYRVPVREEQVTTEKQTVEREEVAFGTRPVQETQRVTETVQREEAHVEYTGDVNVREKGAERGRDARRGRGRRGGDAEDISDQTTP